MQGYEPYSYLGHHAKNPRAGNPGAQRPGTGQGPQRERVPPGTPQHGPGCLSNTADQSSHRTGRLCCGPWSHPVPDAGGPPAPKSPWKQVPTRSRNTASVNRAWRYAPAETTYAPVIPWMASTASSAEATRTSPGLPAAQKPPRPSTKTLDSALRRLCGRPVGGLNYTLDRSD